MGNDSAFIKFVKLLLASGGSGLCLLSRSISCTTSAIVGSEVREKATFVARKPDASRAPSGAPASFAPIIRWFPLAEPRSTTGSGHSALRGTVQ
jgi:hypothetical protein